MLSLVKTPIVVNYDVDIIMPLENYILVRDLIVNEIFHDKYLYRSRKLVTNSNTCKGCVMIHQNYKNKIKENYLIESLDNLIHKFKGY